MAKPKIIIQFNEANFDLIQKFGNIFDLEKYFKLFKNFKFRKI